MRTCAGGSVSRPVVRRIRTPKERAIGFAKFLLGASITTSLLAGALYVGGIRTSKDVNEVKQWVMEVKDDVICRMEWDEPYGKRCFDRTWKRTLKELEYNPDD